MSESVLPAAAETTAGSSSPAVRQRATLTRLWPGLLAADALALTLAAAAAYWARSSVLPDRAFVADAVAAGSLLVAVTWLAVLGSVGAYNRRVIASGQEEYGRLMLASLVTLAVLSTVSYLLKLEVSRGLVLIQIPVGVVLLTVVHGAHARRVRARRRSGEWARRTAVVGLGARARELTDSFHQHAAQGYRVVASIPPPTDTDSADSWIEDLVHRMSASGIEALAVTSAPTLTPDLVRRLGWRLEGLDVDLMVSPDFVDLGGPRVTISRTADMPIIHLDEPQLSGPKRVTKRTMDVVGSGVLLLVLSPILLGIALAIRATSAGPAFYRQQRVGRDGRPFDMVKFRTMRAGADSAQDAAWRVGASLGLANKHPSDPRVTSLGRHLRRWSVDAAAAARQRAPRRDVLGRTATTAAGRSQNPAGRTCPSPDRPTRDDGSVADQRTNGRTWEERMQLDLRYVEQWSPGLDLVILGRTVGAVVTGRGAF